MQVTTVRQQLLHFAHVLQSSLFPALEDEIGPLGAKAALLVKVLANDTVRALARIQDGCRTPA